MTTNNAAVWTIAMGLAIFAGAAHAQSEVDLVAQAAAAEIAEYCAPGTQITMMANAITRMNDGTYAAELGAFSCDWTTPGPAFCGSRTCDVYFYAVQGGTVTLVDQTMLRHGDSLQR